MAVKRERKDSTRKVWPVIHVFNVNLQEYISWIFNNNRNFPFKKLKNIVFKGQASGVFFLRTENYKGDMCEEQRICQLKNTKWRKNEPFQQHGIRNAGWQMFFNSFLFFTISLIFIWSSTTESMKTGFFDFHRERNMLLDWLTLNWSKTIVWNNRGLWQR